MRIRETALKFNPPLVKRRTTKRIVLHHTASGDVSAATVHSWHLQRLGGIGYHYLIRQDGSIERGRPEDTRGAHSPAANAVSIAIALTGNFENHVPAIAQLNALDWLVADIRTRYRDLQIQKHRDVGATLCPGKHFVWREDHMFTDQDQAQFPQEIQRAAELGIISGFPDGTFKPQEPVTREHVVYMLMRVLRHLER